MKKSTSASVGEVYAVPLEDGRFGIAQVVSKDGRHMSVIAFDHIGARPKSLEEVPRLPLLCEASMAPGGTLTGKPTPIIRWIGEPPPRGYVLLGVRAVSAADARRKCDAYSGWENVAATILIEWLRTNDPKRAEALLASWRGERERAAKRYQASEKKRVAALTLEGLERAELLARWVKRFPKAVAAARKILRTAIRDFKKLKEASEGKGAPTHARAREAIVRRGVDAFNALDGTSGLAITTIEREELCQAFADICHAAGWRTKRDVTERWRDW
jgi:hypothetical protein